MLAAVDPRRELTIDVDPARGGTQTIELEGAPPKRDMPAVSLSVLHAR
jgi:hypothetical protein